MSQVAFMTFGVLLESRDHQQSKGFTELIPVYYDVAERSHGFIDRSHSDPDTGLHSWGELVRPDFLPEDLNPNVARTLTLWNSLESVFAFSFTGPHAEVLGRRKEWFRKPEFPSYVIWWVDDRHIPTFRESTARLELLHANGPSKDAFTFKHAFDAEGNSTTVDHAVVRELAKRNATTE